MLGSYAAARAPKRLRTGDPRYTAAAVAVRGRIEDLEQGKSQSRHVALPDGRPGQRGGTPAGCWC